MYNYSVAFKYAGEEKKVEAKCSVNLTSETFSTDLKDFASFVIGDYLRLTNLQNDGSIPYCIRIYKWDDNKYVDLFSTANLRD